MTRGTVALFGNVAIPEVKCPKCLRKALVIGGKTGCCDILIPDLEIKGYRRRSTPEQARKRTPLRIRRQVLKDQHNCCFYCDRAFGGTVFKKGTPIQLRVHYDHFISFHFSQNNKENNIVASCQICNQMKRDQFFATEEQARLFLHLKWIEKGITDGPEAGKEAA